jgi:hypothetical protein
MDQRGPTQQGWTSPSIVLSIIGMGGMIFTSYNLFKEDTGNRISRLEWQADAQQQQLKEQKALLDNLWGKLDDLRLEQRGQK